MTGTDAFDAVVVGGGLAGLSAALQYTTLNPSAKLLLLDKEAKVGGNSAKASSGINSMASPDDTAFYDDTLKSAGDHAQPNLIHHLVDNAQSAIEFVESFGVDLSKMCQLGGHSAERTHRNPRGPNVGFAIVSALKAEVEKRSDAISVATGARALSLSKRMNAITGVVYEQDGKQTSVSSKAVILATGGFGASKEMLAKYSPGSEKFATTNGPWATGEGMILSEDVGAQLIDMDQIQIHPTGFVDPSNPSSGTKFLAPEALRGSGAILLNKKGRRFVNELDTRDKVSSAILAQEQGTAFLVLGKDGATKFGATIGFYVAKNLMKKVTSMKALAEVIGGVDEEVVTKELTAYHDALENGKDGFGKTIFPTSLGTDEDEFHLYIASIVPVVHYTMGGARINERAEVLSSDSNVIKNLYAAGEVSGGVHGSNRLGGNSLLECVVYGRTAATSAFESLN